VTHTPPFGVLDVASSGDIHLGCPHLRRELERIRPQIHAFGHVHASSGVLTKDGIHFVNAAVVGGPGGEVRNKPVSVDVV
jgi:Icc-related predicted phosphoesterase